MVNETHFSYFAKLILLWRNLKTGNYRQVEKHMLLVLKQYGTMKDYLVDRQTHA